MVSACPWGHDGFFRFTQYGLGGMTSCGAALGPASSAMDGFRTAADLVPGGTQRVPSGRPLGRSLTSGGAGVDVPIRSVPRDQTLLSASSD